MVHQKGFRKLSAVSAGAFSSASSGILRCLWPVIHTINPSLTIGLEGGRVRCFYSAMSTTLIEIRRAKASDAPDVAGTHDEAWRAAYQGIIPGNELGRASCRGRG